MVIQIEVVLYLHNNFKQAICIGSNNISCRIVLTITGVIVIIQLVQDIF